MKFYSKNRRFKKTNRRLAKIKRRFVSNETPFLFFLHSAKCENQSHKLSTFLAKNKIKTIFLVPLQSKTAIGM